MITFRRITWIIFLLSFCTPLYAFTIQCKSIAGTSAKQCTATGKKASKLYGLTNTPYALCSKALCTIDKKHPNKAQCVCTLYKGKRWAGLSISPTNYAKSKPTWNKNHQLDTVQSNYSLANVTAHINAKPIACRFTKAKPWADCFGARCKVVGPHRVICSCPVSKNKVFAITGPGTVKKCVTKSDQVWSAILLKDSQTNSQFVYELYYKLYPHSPVSKAR